MNIQNENDIFKDQDFFQEDDDEINHNESAMISLLKSINQSTRNSERHLSTIKNIVLFLFICAICTGIISLLIILTK